MNYLSLLTLNPRSRMVRNELRDPYEQHRTIMRGFSVPRESADILFRLEQFTSSDRLYLLVQSSVEPDWTPLQTAENGRYLCAPPACKTVDLTIKAKMRLQFRLVANPTTRHKRFNPDGTNQNSQRRPISDPAQQIAWLEQQAELNGFELETVQITDNQSKYSVVKQITTLLVQYDGLLQINDPDRFQKSWIKGIGPAKAFGCGLLSFAPA